MPLMAGLTDEEAQTIAADVLSRALAAAGFDHVEVRSGRDHDGDPALFVDVILKSGSPEMVGETYARAHGAVDDAFRARGETRFPYFGISRPDDPVVVDDEAES